MQIMRLRMSALALCGALFCGLLVPLAGNRTAIASAAQGIPAPEEVLGFRPGDDRKLASWKSIVEYFRRLDAASDRVQFTELGKTTMGAPFVMATISAPENLKRLAE